MQIDKSFYLPSEFECFRKKIESSIIRSLWITPIEGSPSLTDCKFTGYPYLPKSHLYPKDSNGEFMPLLAQINFSQLPPQLSFPKEGILQFFISNQFSQPLEKRVELLFQQDFKVRFFSTILNEDELIQDFSYLKVDSKFPIQKEMKLKFEQKLEPISASDYRREKLFQSLSLEYAYINEDDRTLEEIYFEKFLAAEHKLGGYPYFIEYDTRKDSAFLKKFDTLLFQIVSNDEQGIMYGDSGIIKFFINQQALKNSDFSSIYFIAEQF